MLNSSSALQVRALIVFTLVLCVHAAPSWAAKEAPHANVGQSIAHPLTRFDLRLKYQDLHGNQEASLLEARLERPFQFENKWTLNARLSMTGWWSDISHDADDGAEYHIGTGDLHTQLFFIAPAMGRTSIGFGVRNYFPVATEDQFGFGKYRMAPFFVVQRQSTWLPAGSFYGLGIRNEFSIAGDRRHEDVNRLQIVPSLTVVLPRQSFVTLFPEIVIDWERDNGAFVPLDVEVGRKYAPDRAASLRLQVPLINDLDSYDWTLEVRWSMFF
jgi:hypothetical protein